MCAVSRPGVARPLLAALLAVATWGVARAAAQEPLASPPAYRLGPRDLLRIKVLEVPELNVESRVSAAGTVSLPQLGDVAAAGLTDVEFAARLEELLEARYVNRATVTIEVLEARSRPITLVGAVKGTGSIAVPGRWTLLELLVASGGLADNHGDRVYVLRRADNELADQLVIDVDDLLLRGLPEANIPIFSGDLVNVPVRSTVTVYCLGAVRSPGEISFSSSERIGLLAVIVRAGGLSDTASKKIRIKRRRGESFGEEIVVDYKRLLAGKEPDPTLYPGDVVVVRESLF